jgi:hypothetical protein
MLPSSGRIQERFKLKIKIKFQIKMTQSTLRCKVVVYYPIVLNFILIFNLKRSCMRPEDGSMPKHVVFIDELN